MHIALPGATQNEVSKEEAEALVAAGVKIVAEGSNMVYFLALRGPCPKNTDLNLFRVAQRKPLTCSKRRAKKVVLQLFGTHLEKRPMREE